MNTIEERIRAAARAAASTVPPDGVPPLRLPAAGPTPRARRWHLWSSWPGWATRLAPAAAAVAIVAIVLTVVSVGQSVHRPETAGPRPSAAGSAPSVPGTTAGLPISTYVRSGQIPPYYIVIDQRGTPAASPADAEVRRTDSGYALTLIKPSGTGQTIVAVAAAGDDETFVLAEQAWKAGIGAEATKAITFYLIRLNVGRPATRLAVSVPAGQMMTGLALSPDGSKLAIAIRPSQVGPAASTQEIKVYPLGGGPVRTWSGDGAIGAPDDTTSLSWPGSQRTLAFNWQSGQVASVRLLNLETGGGSLLADSRQVMSLPPSYVQPVGLSIITPDGSAVICAASPIGLADGTAPHAFTESGFAEFSTATGHVVRILGHWTGIEVLNVLWSDATGRVLIGVVGSGDHAYAGVISGNTFTPLTQQPNTAAPDNITW